MHTLVVPARDTRGRLALWVLLGMLAGVATSVLNALGRRAGWEWLLICANVGPGVLVILSASMSRTRGGAFLIASVFALAQVLALSVTDIVRDADGITGAMTLTGWNGLGVVLAAAVFSVVTGLLTLGARWLRSRFAMTILVQDGALCWRCGYQPGAVAIVVCPECGTPKGTGQRLARVFGVLDAIKKWSRPALVAAALLGTMLVVIRIAEPRSRRVMAFYSRFHQPIGGNVDGPTGSIQCSGSWLGFARGPGRGIWISYLADDRPGAPAMQLRLATLSTGSMGDVIVPVNPATTCELNRAQAEWVVAHGLPDSLTRAFRERASATGATNQHLPAAPHFLGNDAARDQ